MWAPCLILGEEVWFFPFCDCVGGDVTRVGLRAQSHPCGFSALLLPESVCLHTQNPIFLFSAYTDTKIRCSDKVLLKVG